jgi:hypothetical protein
VRLRCIYFITGATSSASPNMYWSSTRHTSSAVAGGREGLLVTGGGTTAISLLVFVVVAFGAKSKNRGRMRGRPLDDASASCVLTYGLRVSRACRVALI